MSNEEAAEVTISAKLWGQISSEDATAFRRLASSMLGDNRPVRNILIFLAKEIEAHPHRPTGWYGIGEKPDFLYWNGTEFTNHRGTYCAVKKGEAIRPVAFGKEEGK